MVLKAHPTDPDKLIFDNEDRIELLKSLSAPPQREWQGLTEQESGAIMEELDAYGTRLYEFARAIEAKLKEKNT